MLLDGPEAICHLFESSPAHMTMLRAVQRQELPDWWIGAGFVRSSVWDQLHGFTTPSPIADIDVVWFDGDRADPADDDALTARLFAEYPDLPWSVKNQARMHLRNGDPAYRSTHDALRHWPETATAVAITLTLEGAVKLAAPLGIDDLLAMVVRPTPHFRRNRMAVYIERQRQKNWHSRWPLLRFVDD